jgi:hypothetical protein
MALPAETGIEKAAEGGAAEEVLPQEHAGHPFKIEWIKVAPLPFTRLRHLRNPWNQDKEIKVRVEMGVESGTLSSTGY